MRRLEAHDRLWPVGGWLDEAPLSYHANMSKIGEQKEIKRETATRLIVVDKSTRRTGPNQRRPEMTDGRYLINLIRAAMWLV